MDEITLSNATIFRYACDTLVEKMNQGFFESDTNIQQEEKTKLNQSLVFPVIVNASFACELFLKSLLPSNTHGHNCFPNWTKICKIKLWGGRV